MSLLLTTILPALLPALSDGVRGVFSRLTGGKGAMPQNVAEVIQLMNAENERLKALAQLDAVSGDIHKWVASLRALQRPAIATLIIVAYVWAIAVNAPESYVTSLGDYTAMVTFYLFGDRSYNAWKKGR